MSSFKNLAVSSNSQNIYNLSAREKQFILLYNNISNAQNLKLCQHLSKQINVKKLVNLGLVNKHECKANGLCGCATGNASECLISTTASISLEDLPN